MSESLLRIVLHAYFDDLTGISVILRRFSIKIKVCIWLRNF